MKLPLTSSGLTNESIKNSLLGLLGKPFAESKLVFIPTAADIESSEKSWLIRDLYRCEGVGFKEVDILDLAAVPQEKFWKPRIESADVILCGGGNSFFLMHWMKKSGFAAALPEFLKTKVYMGISAGSIVTAPNLSLSRKKRKDLFKLYHEEVFGTEGNDIEKGLGLVNFHIRPHLNSEHFPHARAEYLAEVAKEIKEPLYAIDDQSALEVIDGKVTVVSEGEYLTFNL